MCSTMQLLYPQYLHKVCLHYHRITATTDPITVNTARLYRNLVTHTAEKPQFFFANLYTITITMQLSTAECCGHVKKSTWQRAWQENVCGVTGVNSSTGL